MTTLDWAIKDAANAHSGQTRKDGRTPYIVHPVRVMAALQLAGVKDFDILAAAVLHDTIEDTELIHGDIASRISTEAADIVQELTKDYASGSRGAVRQAYVERFKTASPEACLIKMADRADNLNDTGLSEDYLVAYAEEGLAFYDAIQDNARVNQRIKADGEFRRAYLCIGDALLEAIAAKGVVV